MNLKYLAPIVISITSISQFLPPAQAAIVTRNPPLVTSPNTTNKIAAWNITGIYMNFNGQPFYLGEYAQQGDNGIVFQGSTWEVKSNGSVIGHGYGRVSGRFRQWACSKLGC